MKTEILTENAKNDFPTIKDGKLILRLKETNTMWLLSMDSKYSMDDDVDINRVKMDNEEYAKLTKGKSLERKRSEDETQTPQRIEKSKGTMTTEIIKVDSFVNASAWDLYDTYAELVSGVSVTEKDFQKLIDAVLKAKDVALGSLSGTSRQSYDEKMEQIFHRDDFKYALLTAERLLASNRYLTEQSLFKKCLPSKYDDIEPTNFTYEGCNLWKYRIKNEESLSVTAMDWNPSNADLLAVGYGNVQGKSDNFGRVCIWSPKNPVHAERVFTLGSCVTSLAFSVIRPNILAIGCRNGDVCVSDISTDEGCTRLLRRDRIHSRHGPVWKIQWFVNKRLFKTAEELLAMGEGGVLIRYSFPDDKETDSLLKINYVSAIKKSFLRPAKKKNLAIGEREVRKVTKTFVKHSFSGLWFSTTSDEKLCYISTKEGVLIKTVLINNCRVENLTSCHVGPIYEVELSPFTDLFYLTCGADWSLRIWMEGLAEPLFTLKMHNPVMSAKWSPNIATLIGAISGPDFALWDIARNVFLPANLIHFDGPNFSKLLFSPKGSNVVLGDENGVLRVLHLSQLPRQPFLQKEALVNAIDRGLFNKTELLKKFKRLVSLNKEALKTEIVFS